MIHVRVMYDTPFDSLWACNSFTSEPDIVLHHWKSKRQWINDSYANEPYTRTVYTHRYEKWDEGRGHNEVMNVY